MSGKLNGLDRVSRWVVTGGTVFFAAWGLLAPRRLATAMVSTRGEAITLGFRDLGSAVLLCSLDGPVPFAVRAIFDTGDAVRLREERPKAALLALGFGGVSVLQAIRRRAEV
jgi:hypothetical protein